MEVCRLLIYILVSPMSTGKTTPRLPSCAGISKSSLLVFVIRIFLCKRYHSTTALTTGLTVETPSRCKKMYGELGLALLHCHNRTIRWKPYHPMSEACDPILFQNKLTCHIKDNKPFIIRWRCWSKDFVRQTYILCRFHFIPYYVNCIIFCKHSWTWQLNL